MPKKQTDIEIGHRAYEEAIRVFVKPRFAYKTCGLNRQTLYNWKDGNSPSALFLSKLHYAGADVMYILTGQRREAGR